MEDDLLDVSGLQELSAHGEILREIAQIWACNGFLLISSLLRGEYFDQCLDEFKVVLIVEWNKVLFPEPLGVHGVPSEAAVLTDFSLELFNAWEALLVFVEEFEQLLKECTDVLVHPMPVLQLDDGTKEVDVGHDLMADATGILQVV